MISDSNFLKLCREAFKAAYDATSELVGTDSASSFVCMGADGTPTTSIDQVAEDAIVEVFKADGRPMRVISEELGELIIGSSPEFSVVLDPLDGTYNASAGIPFYSVSIAFASHDLADLKFGYVSNLALKEEYYAEAGKGAYLNGNKIKTSMNSDLKNLCVSVYGYRQNVERTRKIYSNVRRVRLFGSVALELCYVASGRLDAFVDVRKALRVTDVAAGQLILEEAGGLVTDGYGKTLRLPDNVTARVEMVASNGHVHNKLLSLLSGG
ncbi:bifunctional fructose-bisphosphatase/inositol-phosphate phosphatase [Methanosarcina sp. DH2]|jgi:myo-inositol-1(or 4)-monophosphatase|uniref:bifunctional fructose-bisphosphatase/inositol-phosphate phosphatase n=1 Tax=Methanosarcina sp. DH2 TaxID=2605639 RepID=UPI001E417848|nr:bifunctional fructose-bisphosphatase/inositol-phosphate phosphatase [Methanosarcina sp. DH2]MCC4769607.1 bifunctional fructose-bisphosphatase/inositol-phosphate phosphatase [Methanosarcina sp. DH2]